MIIGDYCATFATWISYLISPPTCVSCGIFLSKREPLCGVCSDAIEPIVSYALQVTRSQSITVHAVTEYTGIFRSLVLAKHAGQRLASRQLGYLIAQRSCVDWSRVDYIIPVPLHWQRYAQRGFNQSEEIAHCLSRAFSLPVSSHMRRVVATGYQARLKADDRRKNVKNVFTIPEHVRHLYRDKHLLIVDDVLTTGATLAEVARELLLCQPASITAVVAARVVIK